jgi:DNA-3-methyladenine glycosylase II
MQLVIPTRKPFSFAQTLTFARRFAPLETNAILDADSLTAALAAHGRAWPFELRDRDGDLVATLPDGAPPELARRIADFVGADDDLAPFYAAAAGDAPMRPLIAELHGLHQVRFLGLEEISVYCTMMQRAPIAAATRMKRAFLERFGHVVQVRGRTLHAMPELADLARLEAPAIAAAIRHPAKAERIVTIVRAVAALGEAFLRTAPYAKARDALLEIPGVGPFSAGAILLRGLGRADELPSLVMFEDAIDAVYVGVLRQDRGRAAQ